MLISAIQPFTMIDYPEKISCIIFTAGCNFRCGYCHNSEFVLPEKIKQIKDSFISEETLFNFLEKRRGWIEGVVVSGGEPTVMGDLPTFLKKIKDMGFLVKLDTNGNKPEILKYLIEQKIVDYVAMDLKTDLDHYLDLVGKCVRPEKIKESIDLLIGSDISYEFRSTLIKEVHTKPILDNMASLIDGACVLYLQQFRSGETLSPVFDGYSAFCHTKLLEDIVPIFSPFVNNVFVR